MLKIFAIMSFLFLAVSAHAEQTVSEVILQNQLKNWNSARAIDWKPGDSASYNLDMGILKGSMVSSVASNDGNEIWIHQDMDLGFAGKQKSETLIDANTGAIKKVLVNGQEQEIPKQDLEVVQIVDDTITVPAGTFKCLHATLTDKSSNEEINMWSSSQVSMSGMVKQIAPSQFGKVTVELTSYKKQ